MKRIALVLLLLILLLLGAACGSSATDASANDAASTGSDAAEAVSEDASAVDTSSGSSSSPSSTAVNSDATGVASQDCFEGPYCFRPTADGTYHFSAITADAFVGEEYDYASDTITWDVYVLEEEFDDAWRFLGQAYYPAILELNGSVDLTLKAGEYVYCVCSLNAFSGSAAPDDSGVLTITPLEEEVYPSADNNYQIAVATNTETRFDLDGDGTEETIYYSVQPDEADANSVWIGARVTSFQVDGVEYAQTALDNPMERFDLWLENPDVDEYFIVDLDASDAYYEIALVDDGSSDCVATHYFRYVEDALVYLGSTSRAPDEADTVFHGDGSVSAMTDLNVMQSWSGLCTYVLEDGQMTLQSGGFVTPVLPDGWTVSFVQDSYIYASPDRTSEVTTLSAASSITFPSTDGEHWVEIACPDGTGGWVYFSDYSTLELPDGQLVDEEELFGNLYLVS